jgi:transcriptional regulator
MYLPGSFQESDRNVLFDLIDDHGFATIVSTTDAEPMVSHLPLLVDRHPPGRERLLGHVARANDHFKTFERVAAVLAIFHGPHAYVSPAWYETYPSVPTWNYAVVHVHGKARLVDAAATRTILDRLVGKYEARREKPWDGRLPEDFVVQELRAIVGFEIVIERLEGKFKLSQNRDAADREGALAGLEHEPDAASRELAAFSRRYLARPRRA